MKKLTSTLTILFALALYATAQNGGVFQRGFVSDEMYYNARTEGGESLILPNSHGSGDDAQAPLGGGTLLLIGLGAAYAVGKKRKEKRFPLGDENERRCRNLRHRLFWIRSGLSQSPTCNFCNPDFSNFASA